MPCFALLHPRAPARLPWAATALIAALSLGGCAIAPPPRTRPAPIESAPTATPAGAHAKARWIAAEWSELPGWDLDTLAHAWPALLRSCSRPGPEWARPCAAAATLRPDDPLIETQARQWARTWLQPYRIETPDGQPNGWLTGYFEPLLDARRQPDATYRVPLYAPPADLAARQPYWSRAELATDPTARAALRGREIVYVADPLDALSLQIQGSGRVRLLDSPASDGQPRLIRLAFAGHNSQPYQSIGRWLIEQGQLGPDAASWPAIRAWARLHPERLDELLHANPRVVFFKEEPLTAPDTGPLGAQGVPLTPERSIAVDKEAIPYGTPVWLVSTEPQPWVPLEQAPLPRALQRLMLAQDTGSAITGAVRADYFWGWGPQAETQAGRTRQPLRLWALWPKLAPSPHR